jgi:hypothetical protein
VTEMEKLQRDMKTLRESIELNKLNLHQRTQEEIQGIIENTARCMRELESLETEAKRLLAKSGKGTPVR